MRCRLQERQVSRRGGHAYAHRMSRAQVTFNSGKVLGRFAFMRGGVGQSAGVAELFIHPRNYPDSAPGMQPKLLDQLRRLHGHNHASAIVNGSSAQVP